MEVKKAKIGNALTSSAANHVVAVSGDIYDESKERYQSDINEDAVRAKIVADKAAADVGVDSITLLQGGIDSDGKENVSSYYLRTSRFSTFKLEVNDGYTIGQIAQYDLAGNFVSLYNDYTQPIEGVEWTPTSVVATDKNYYWVAVVFKGNSPTVAIYPREEVVKSFASGLYYYMEGGESDPQSAAAQAKTIVNRTIEQLPNTEDLVLVDEKMQLANRSAMVKDGEVSHLGYVVLRKNKSFTEQVTAANTIYEIRYNFDLGGKTVTLKEGCTLKFSGGMLSNGSLNGANSHIESNISQIFKDITIGGTWSISNCYPQWFGGLGDDNIDCTSAIEKCGNFSCNINLIKGIYKCNINLPRRVLRGVGASHTILKPYTSDKPVISIDEDADWNLELEIDSLSIKGDGTGVAIELGATNQNAGRIKVSHCNIENFEKGFVKANGNIGNLIENCDFRGNDYHYYATSSSKAIMHAGCDIISRCSFYTSNIAAIYINSPQDGTGQTTIRDCIFEANKGFTLFVDSYGDANLFPALLFDNNWQEGSNTEKTVTINGETYNVSSIYLKSVKFAILSNINLTKLHFVNSNVTAVNCAQDDNKYNLTNENSCFTIESFGSQTAMNGNIYTSRIMGFTNSVCYEMPAKTVAIRNKGTLIQNISFQKTVVLNGTSQRYATIVDDGLVYSKCCEYSIPETSSNGFYFPDKFSMEGQKYIVVNFQAKLVSGAARIFIGNINTTANIDGLQATLQVGGWRNYTAIINNSSERTGSIGLIVSGKVASKLRLSNLQAVSFETREDALRFANSNNYIDSNSVADTTEKRPNDVAVGYQYFDTTLSKPIWWTGEKWVDSTGAEV